MDKFENYCENYGFVPDDTKIEFKRILSRNKFKTIHIDTYTLDSDMLFLRNIANNVATIIEDGRLIICKKDKWNTQIVNISLDCITNCIVKVWNDVQYEILFVVHNVYYKVLVIV